MVLTRWVLHKAHPPFHFTNSVRTEKKLYRPRLEEIRQPGDLPWGLVCPWWPGEGSRCGSGRAFYNSKVRVLKLLLAV